MVKILVVDDQSSVRKRLKYILEHKEHVVVLAANAKEAQEALNREPVDLIFLDLWMPGQNGLEFIKEAKSDERFSNLPVIVYSAFADPTLCDKYERYFDLIIEKPCEINHITEAVERVLGVTRN